MGIANDRVGQQLRPRTRAHVRPMSMTKARWQRSSVEAVASCSTSRIDMPSTFSARSAPPVAPQQWRQAERQFVDHRVWRAHQAATDRPHLARRRTRSPPPAGAGRAVSGRWRSDRPRSRVELRATRLSQIGAHQRFSSTLIAPNSRRPPAHARCRRAKISAAVSPVEVAASDG